MRVCAREPARQRLIWRATVGTFFRIQCEPDCGGELRRRRSFQSAEGATRSVEHLVDMGKRSLADVLGSINKPVAIDDARHNPAFEELFRSYDFRWVERLTNLSGRSCSFVVLPRRPASEFSSTPSKSADNDIPSVDATLRMFEKLRLLSPRSTVPMKVL